jgi:hyperosmotically inducible periplasmic protein
VRALGDRRQAAASRSPTNATPADEDAGLVLQAQAPSSDGRGGGRFLDCIHALGAKAPTGQQTETTPQEPTMFVRQSLAAVVTAVAALTMLPGCAVTRGQSTVGEYIDDTAITTAVKARFVDSTQVDASAISVETLDGTVMLSGFAKSQTERNMAESIARATKGVKSVKNQLALRG